MDWGRLPEQLTPPQKKPSTEPQSKTAHLARCLQPLAKAKQQRKHWTSGRQKKKEGSHKGAELTPGMAGAVARRPFVTSQGGSPPALVDDV